MPKTYSNNTSTKTTSAYNYKMQDFIYTQPITILILLSILLPLKKLIVIGLLTLGFYLIITLHNSIRLLTTYLDIRFDLNLHQRRISIQNRDTPADWNPQEVHWNTWETVNNDNEPNIDF